MSVALDEARVAALRGEVPVGCVLVEDPYGPAARAIAQAHNLRELLEDPTAHAEVLAMRAAALHRNSWRLDGVTAYVTLEPCPMCAGAFINARVPRVIYGCDDARAGALRSLYRLGEDPRFNHRYEVLPGVMAAESAALLKAFFVKLRARRKRG